MTRIGLGLNQELAAILVILLVSSTSLTLGLACVETHKCTHTHTGKSDSKSEKIIYYSEKGGAAYKMLG